MVLEDPNGPNGRWADQEDIDSDDSSCSNCRCSCPDDKTKNPDRSILLPDISECNKLQILKISNGYFRFPGNLEGKHPLPNNLEKLTLDDVQFGDRGSKDMNPMRDLTSMCPNLKMLAYKAKDHNWPSSTPAWSLLEELYLDYQDEYTFRDVELHTYLPNLKTLFLTNYWESMLPDMRGCDKGRYL